MSTNPDPIDDGFFPKDSDEEIAEFLRTFRDPYEGMTNEEILAESLSFGLLNVNGVSIEPLENYSNEQIEKMNAVELRNALKFVQYQRDQMLVKLTQLRRYVSSETYSRDPNIVNEVLKLLTQGRTDSEIAEIIGEKRRFVQEVRLYLARDVVEFKKERGRPKNAPKTP